MVSALGMGRFPLSVLVIVILISTQSVLSVRYFIYCASRSCGLNHTARSIPCQSVSRVIPSLFIYLPIFPLQIPNQDFGRPRQNGGNALSVRYYILLRYYFHQGESITVNVLGAAADLLIAATLCSLLNFSRTGFHRWSHFSSIPSRSLDEFRIYSDQTPSSINLYVSFP